MAKQKRSARLQVLLQLARLREEGAARSLAEHSEKLQQAQRQSRQLEQYGEEYAQQYAARAAQPLAMRELRNFQGFLRQLDDVQAQQLRAIEQRDAEREQARRQWLQLYQRRRVLDQIRARASAQEEAARERKLQSEFDDRFAAFARKP